MQWWEDLNEMTRYCWWGKKKRDKGKTGQSKSQGYAKQRKVQIIACEKQLVKQLEKKL